MDKGIEALIARKGNAVTGNYYLAECGNCSEMFPSERMTGGEALYAGDYGDCYCPHCGAADCDISDYGDILSNAGLAWNYQQKHIDALIAALEQAQQRNGYLREQSAEWERKAISNFEECSEMSVRMEEVESQRKLAFTACNRWRDKCVDADKRIAELEAASVKFVNLPDAFVIRSGHPINENERSVMIPKDGGNWFSRLDIEHALRVAGVKFDGGE